MDTTFKGAAKRITDIDIPRIGAIISVGEDEIHAFMDVGLSACIIGETSGGVFGDTTKVVMTKNGKIAASVPNPKFATACLKRHIVAAESLDGGEDIIG